MKNGGIEIVIYRGVLRRRSEDTRYSHFAGTPEELMSRTLSAWHNAKFRKSDQLNARDTYVVTVLPQNFFAKKGACLVHDRPDQVLEPRWAKRTAARAEVVVRIAGRSPTGAVTKLEIIDLQAFPTEQSVSSGEIRQSV
jgi:hypothetical protein